MNDDAIIENVLRGNRDQFAALVQRHESWLMCYLRNLLPNHHDCEEIVQDVFLRAFQKLHEFDASRAAFRTWLTVIARRRALNHIAKQRPQTGRTLSEPTDPASDSDNPTPLEQDEWLQQLDAALAGLPFEQRSAFVLAEIQELPLARVAEIEATPLGTVKSRVSRAKQKLRSLLQNVAPLPNNQREP